MTERTALITGASRGIGLACAHALASTGARVILAARDAAKLEAASAGIPGSSWITLDMSSPESIKEAFAKAGKVDILVNNAAVTKDGLALRMKKDDRDTVLSTNLTGAFLAIQQVMQGMMKERWGRIINIASVVGEMGNAGQANYVASKAGLIGLTKTLAQELASRGITVNAVTPGFIETDMTAPSKARYDKMIDEGLTVIKRFGTPEEVGRIALTLAQGLLPYTTGQVIHADGGLMMVRY